ncbi:nucleotidyltransferase family protein [Rhizobiaceae bacterium]|nr:nucleotidyltransferase family protein [Rhizobiaceae bacterium]
MKITQAMILAGGLGTRMRPLTDTRPKPLVEVAGRALIDHALDALGGAGVQRVAVNVHYLADQIESHLAQRKSPATAVSDERARLLDSGGGVKAALPLLDAGPLFVLNADSFWVDGAHANLARMAETFDPTTTDMMLLVSSHSDAVGFDGRGDFFMDDDACLTRRGDADAAPYVYAGAILSDAALYAAEADDSWSLNRLFDAAIAKKRLRGCVLEGLWLHVGTPQAIGEAETAITAFNARAA